MKKICPQCNEEFSKPKFESKKAWETRHVYCSIACYNKSKVGRVSPKKGKPSGFVPWNKGVKTGRSTKNTSIEKLCLECNNKFEIRKYRENTALFCSVTCCNKHKDSGKRTDNKKARQSVEFRLWREAVFARDNWTCQKTGAKGGTLHPHHILNFAEYPELRFNVDNGVTLSEKAHKEFHNKYGQRNNTKAQLLEFISNKAVAVEA